MLLNEPIQFVAGKLRERLQLPLPGETAQYRMTSRAHVSTSEYLRLDPGHRTSAVLMLLYPHNGSIHTLLIIRPEYDGVHSGQIALPGGRAEPADASPQATALRETFEEVGVTIDPENVLGQLSPVFIPVSRYLVQPFVAAIDARPGFMLDPREVEGILEVPLDTFLDETIKERRRIPIGKNLFVDAPCYILEGRVLWGATAMMFSEMEAILRTLLAEEQA